MTATTGATRWMPSTLIVVLGLVFAAVALYIGWQLPHRQECSGDSCQSTAAIDWSRVDWSIPPEQYACGVPHPGSGNVLIGPGDVCVTSLGDGTVIGRATYEELRERATQRRTTTLAVIGLIVAASVVAAVLVSRRRPRTGAEAHI